MHASLFTRSKARARGKFFWAGLLRISGVLFLAKSWVRRRGALVLTFHRVLADADLEHTASMPGMVVRQQTFSRFLEHAAETCRFVDLSRDPDWQPGSRLKLAMTFDDGWSDNASIAYPIARSHSAPMLIFIVPAKVGSALPFWPERAASAMEQGFSRNGHEQSIGAMEQAIETLKGLSAQERDQRLGDFAAGHPAASSVSPVDTTMTWEQIAELQSGGVSFGSHTITHEILTAIPLAQAEEEISGSRVRIERKLGTPCRLFSYPNGDFSDPVRDLVQRAGYSFAFLNQDPGIWTRDCDPYLVPRINVCEYHLVDAKGNFSPLIFEYAVVWNAVKGSLARMRAAFFNKLRRKWQAWFRVVAHHGDKPITTKDTKKHEGLSSQ
jgi:peptidoglycan/xylan/chitin deacetylase (PgdA/CDA1 family)